MSELNIASHPDATEGDSSVLSVFVRCVPNTAACASSENELL